MPKNADIYICKKCDFHTSRQSNYNKHILTRKHKNRTLRTQKEQKNAETNTIIYLCEICGKEYLARNSLWYHKKKCNDKKEENDLNVEPITSSSSSSSSSYTNDILLKLAANQEKMAEFMKDVIPHIGNNNNNTNTFNLSIFLNEQCKDALNISDFVESLHIESGDLDSTRQNGLGKSITDIFVNGLKQLDTHKRPIHCTDMKREVLYIKDNNEWEKEANNEKLKKSIDLVADKQRKKIKEWEEKHPKWMESEDSQMEYFQLVRNVMADVDTTKESNKIIKRIAKEVTIEK